VSKVYRACACASDQIIPCHCHLRRQSLCGFLLAMPHGECLTGPTRIPHATATNTARPLQQCARMTGTSQVQSGLTVRLVSPSTNNAPTSIPRPVYSLSQRKHDFSSCLPSPPHFRTTPSTRYAVLIAGQHKCTIPVIGSIPEGNKHAKAAQSGKRPHVRDKQLNRRSQIAKMPVPAYDAQRAEMDSTSAARHHRSCQPAKGPGVSVMETRRSLSDAESETEGLKWHRTRPQGFAVKKHNLLQLNPNTVRKSQIRGGKIHACEPVKQISEVVRKQTCSSRRLPGRTDIVNQKDKDGYQASMIKEGARRSTVKGGDLQRDCSLHFKDIENTSDEDLEPFPPFNSIDTAALIAKESPNYAEHHKVQQPADSRQYRNDRQHLEECELQGNSYERTGDFAVDPGQEPAQLDAPNQDPAIYPFSSIPSLRPQDYEDWTVLRTCVEQRCITAYQSCQPAAFNVAHSPVSASGDSINANVLHQPREASLRQNEGFAALASEERGLGHHSGLEISRPPGKAASMAPKMQQGCFSHKVFEDCERVQRDVSSRNGSKQSPRPSQQQSRSCQAVGCFRSMLRCLRPHRSNEGRQLRNR